MRKTNERIQVDKRKIQKIFKEKNMNMRDVSRRIGYYQDYLTNEVNAGYIAKPLAIMLETVFGVKPEDYAPDKKIDPPVKKQPEEDPEPYQDLKKAVEEVIHESFAMYLASMRNVIEDAASAAINRNLNKIGDEIHEAVKTAFKEV